MLSVLWTNSTAPGTRTGRTPLTTRRVSHMHRPAPRTRSVTSRRRATSSKHKMAAAEVLGNQLKLYKIRKHSDVIEIYLAKKRLTEVPDLSRFKQLKYLWLNHNKIKKISSLTMNYCLKELYLQNNLLIDVTDTLKHLTNLEILMLHNNWLTKLEKVIAELKKLMWLHTLNLFNNPLTQDQDYRLYVIYHLPSVQLLDRKCSMTPVPHQKGILKKMKKKISETSKEEAVERVRKISEMKFSTFNWSKLPNAQQKHLGDENAQIIATKFR
ncbi:leucine-rich repeat-containing protein 72 isoform X5 [Hemitrygon akajei]|uniref:leucine-rich repeat-containing protein 72 isoform X5 n=1 Tax=Hemitrygon akajei TaxID=2704970 RepID=UPI003BF9FAEC